MVSWTRRKAGPPAPGTGSAPAPGLGAALFGGAPVVILSGRRCVPWNRLCGGEDRSLHLVGEAADHFVMGVPHRDLLAYYMERLQGRYGLGCYPSFTHLDVRPGTPARW